MLRSKSSFMTKAVLAVVVAAMVLLAGSPGALVQAQQKQYTIATVVKLIGVGWFNRMEEGVKRFAEDYGVNAFQIGPSEADAALQVQMIEDLIAQGVDAITVVPNSVEALEPVLKKAMDRGIIVIVHEAENQINAHYDIEAFDNEEYGRHFMQLLGEMMGGEGEYATFVGALTAKSHNQWVDASIAYQKEHFPNMKLVTERIETFENQQNAYNRTKELLITYPELVGFQGSAATDVAGIGLAIEEMGLEDETFVVGTSIPSVAGQYLQTGAVDVISFWDPAAAGYAMNKLALLLLEGKEIYDGMDLEIPYPGYDNLRLDGKVLRGQAWVDVTAENMHEYDF